MTWENTASLTERIRYLQEWTPASQRQKITERARSPYNIRNQRSLSEAHVRSSVAADSKKSLGDFFSSVASLKEEIASLKKQVESLSNENSSLRKSKRDVEDTLALTKMELAESEAKNAESDFAAAESRARMAALDQDVEKLCELSKLLSEENATLQAQIQERDAVIRVMKETEKCSVEKETMESLAAEKQALEAEVKALQRRLEEKEREWEREMGAMQKVVEEMRLDREELHAVKEETKVEKEALHAEKEGLQAEVIKALMQAKEERERLEGSLDKSEQKAASEAAKVAELADQVAELEEAVVEYEGEMKHLSEDVERAAAEAAASKERASKLEADLAQRSTKLAVSDDLDIAQLSRQLSSLLFYRESSSEVDRLVQVEFENMTQVFSRSLAQVEAKISEWKERMNLLEEALEAATNSATSSQQTATHLLSELSAVTSVLNKPCPPKAPPPPPSSPPRRRASTCNLIPATAVASGALAGGIYAFKLLRARSFGG
ncbi:hypothetical protein L7F22_014119 [Adiantum nelumboides]|nr:hypothetical protein [Adiantum nelumboides]